MRIELRDIHVTLADRPVLTEVGLSFREGEQVAILGPSGAGKTTLLRVIVGAVAPQRGAVLVDGIDPHASRAALTMLRRSIGCVRQRDDLVRGVTARTNILASVAYQWRLRDWGSVLLGNVPRRYRDRLAEVTMRYEIAEVLAAPVERLSGGQRQRVAVARAVFGRPRLLLADESTSGLDPVRATRALDDLQYGGATLIATTHDLRIAQRFPRVIALRDGAVVFDGGFTGPADLRRIYGDDTGTETVA
ncbi:ATP-binding cassette domain-containing protein [Actinomadura alba]|uniref:ATP-binding cassette domain-containing protein n=1 Tax=Actinomadura alba TaxID=406431 RepID=A0ABR7LZS7_9ACTN|nr:ATP-binding cassette domain-containing protein [Actinomadura alba]MBC6470265.1 ATP-binding cassette domain-containing protein [Actinomadura alba]